MVEYKKGKKGEKTRDPILNEGMRLYDQLGERRSADAELERVFKDGVFTGKLYEAMGINVKTATTNRLLVNLVRASTIDRSTMLGSMPEYKYEVLGAYNEDVALTEQEVLINLHETLWDNWRLERTLRAASFNLALKNRAAWIIYPDFKKQMPILYTLDPGTFYGESDYRGDYNRVFLISEENGYKIAAQYGNVEAFGVVKQFEKYKVVWFIDDKVKRVWINGVEAESLAIEHNLGFCPVRYTQDIHIPGSIDNLGSAYHSIALSENFTDVLLLSSLEMRKHVKSVPWFKGEGIDGAQVGRALEGNEAIDLGADGAFGFSSSVDSTMGSGQHLQSLDDLFRVITNWPRIRSGQISSSIWTQRGIDAAQGAVSDNILQARQAIAYDLQFLDEAAIFMLKKMWPNKEYTLQQGEYEGKGSIRIVPALDLPLTFKHKILANSLSADVASKTVLLMQLFGQKLLDRKSVLEQLPGINPSEVMRRLEEDMMRDTKWQMMLQQQMAAMAGASQSTGQGQDQAQAEAEIQNQSLAQGATEKYTPGNLLYNGLVPTPNPPFVGYQG